MGSRAVGWPMSPWGGHPTMSGTDQALGEAGEPRCALLFIARRCALAKLVATAGALDTAVGETTGRVQARTTGLTAVVFEMLRRQTHRHGAANPPRPRATITVL